MHQPLNLPYKHNVYDGVPVPNFISQERMEEIKEKHVSRPDDVFIATYQKSGTTWLQFILNQLYDYPQGDPTAQINLACPWLEETAQDYIDKMSSPRVLKTHDKWAWVPKAKGVRYIYCYRNPKDVCVSYYHHMKTFRGHYECDLTMAEFYDQVFIGENTAEQGSYFTHIAEWLQQSSNESILFLTYEDMVEDLSREVEKIAQFLKVDLSKDKLEGIVSNSMFDSMSKNSTVNYETNTNIVNKDNKFLRKGKVGDWANHLTSEQANLLEEMADKRLLPLGARIRYSL